MRSVKADLHTMRACNTGWIAPVAVGGVGEDDPTGIIFRIKTRVLINVRVGLLNDLKMEGSH